MLPSFIAGGPWHLLITNKKTGIAAGWEKFYTYVGLLLHPDAAAALLQQRRRQAELGAKQIRERRSAVVSHGAADGRDRRVGGFQQTASHLHAAVGQGAQRRDSINLAEDAMEVMRRHAGNAGDLFQAQIFVVRILNANVGTLDAAVEFGARSRPDAVNRIDLAAGSAEHQHHALADGAELVGNTAGRVAAEAGCAESAQLGANLKRRVMLDALREANHDAVVVDIQRRSQRRAEAAGNPDMYV